MRKQEMLLEKRATNLTPQDTIKMAQDRATEALCLAAEARAVMALYPDAIYLDGRMMNAWSSVAAHEAVNQIDEDRLFPSYNGDNHACLTLVLYTEAPYEHEGVKHTAIVYSPKPVLVREGFRLYNEALYQRDRDQRIATLVECFKRTVAAAEEELAKSKLTVRELHALRRAVYLTVLEARA